MNKVEFEPYQNFVKLEPIRIESDYAFISPYQIVDDPKEREE